MKCLTCFGELGEGTKSVQKHCIKSLEEIVLKLEHSQDTGTQILGLYTEEPQQILFCQYRLWMHKDVRV